MTLFLACRVQRYAEPEPLTGVMSDDSLAMELPSEDSNVAAVAGTMPPFTPAPETRHPLVLHGAASAAECLQGGPTLLPGVFFHQVIQEGCPAADGIEERKGEGRVGDDGRRGAAVAVSAPLDSATMSGTTPSAAVADIARAEPLLDRRVPFGCWRSPASVSARHEHDESEVPPYDKRSSGPEWATPPVSGTSRSGDVNGVAPSSSASPYSTLFEADATPSGPSRPRVARDRIGAASKQVGAR